MGADREAPQTRREEEDSVNAGQGDNSVVARRGNSFPDIVSNQQWIKVLPFQHGSVRASQEAWGNRHTSCV